MQPRGRLCGEKTWSVAILAGVYQNSGFKRYPPGPPSKTAYGGATPGQGQALRVGPLPHP
jgi:hypothetical protein